VADLERCVSAQFLDLCSPFLKSNGDIEYSNQKLLIGTHAQSGEENHLQILNVKFPVDNDMNGDG